MKKILLLITILFCGKIFAQDTHLSQDSMYADFDELIFIIENCNAQLPVRKSVTKIDQLSMAKSFRPEIDTISTMDSFEKLLKKVLRCMFDIHAKESKDFLSMLDNLSDIDTVFIEYTAKLPPPQKQYKVTFPGNPICIDNEYFLPYHYILILDNDTTTFHYSKIISYNGIPYPTYVRENLLNYPSSGIRWDFSRNEYYAQTSLIPYSGKLTVEDRGEIRKINLDKRYTIMMEGGSEFRKEIPLKDYKIDAKRVLYFEKDNLLYIYLDKMSEQGDIIQKIKTLGANKNLSKVVIDVRENTGGSDEVWHNILKAIVADSLPYNPIMAFKNTAFLKEKYNYPNSFADINTFDVREFDWLPGESFLVTNFDADYFVPDSNSLKYKRKIYILQNEDVYSAGHSLTSYASHVEQLVSVGEPTGLMAGFGVLPMLFQLKYSKFTFRLETGIDVSHATKPVDVYQDFPEIYIELSPDEKLNYRMDSALDRQCEKYLYEYDYLFKKVLELP